MAQITQGFRSILSLPLVYSTFQLMMGAHQFRTNFVSNHVRPFLDMSLLDIGCGPADILAYLPKINYWGYDISESYILMARATYKDRGHFYCKLLQSEDLDRLPQFDLVLAIGLLHHLDGSDALEVMGLAYRALRPGGRLITVDPCIDSTQNAISRFLVGKDRGQNVREKKGYEMLAASVFKDFNAEVQHQAWIPYTRCIMECTK